MAPKRKVCRFGPSCYRKNPDHLEQFEHPWLLNRSEDEDDIEQLMASDDDQDAQPPLKRLRSSSSPAGETPPSKSPANQNGANRAGGKLSDFGFGNKKPERDSKPQEKVPASEASSSKLDDVETAEKSDVAVDDEVDIDPGDQFEEDNTAAGQSGSIDEEPALEDAGEGEEDQLVTLPPSLESVDDRIKFIEEVFMVSMPPDFKDVWEMANQLVTKPESAQFGQDPRLAFQSAGIRLVGPFDLLMDEFARNPTRKRYRKAHFLTHWRFYYDVPEFQTVAVRVAPGDSDSPPKPAPDGFHIGYFRDNPRPKGGDKKQNPSTIVCSGTTKSCTLKVMGDNLFAAIVTMANNCQPAADSSLIGRLEKRAAAKGCSLLAVSHKVKERKKLVVAAALHSAGIFVPMSGDVGYRELPETNANLKRILTGCEDVYDAKDANWLEKKMEPISEMITFVQYANDECDFGMGLELGLALFCFGAQFLHSRVEHLLSTAYLLLDRSPFTDILKAHLARRRKGVNVGNFSVRSK